MVNFEIEISKDRISVSHADGGWPPDVGTTIVFLILSALTVCIVTAWVTTGDAKLSPSNLLLLLVMILFAGTALWTAWRSLFPSGESLACDRDELTIGRIPSASLRGQWTYETFPLTAVKELQFATVSFGGRTPVLGLRFKVEGTTKSILGGLESPEAARILDALVSLGVNVVRDPAMPMMVQMALSRRKQFGGVV